MENDVIKEAIKRIRGLPTVSRIKKELTGGFNLRVSEDELAEGLEEMVEEGEIKERETTIKRSKFRGYKIAKEKDEKEGEEKEDKTEEEKIIEKVFE